jgi:hypothetical protein
MHSEFTQSAGANATRPVTGQVTYDWILEAFRLYKNDAIVWLLVFTIHIVVTTVIQLLCRASTPFTTIPYVIIHHSLVGIPAESRSGSLVSQILNFLCDAYFYTGLYAMGNKSIRGEQLSVWDLFAHSDRYFSFLAYYCISSIAIFIGFLACCVGSSWTFMMVEPGFAILADDGSVPDAFKRSIQGMQSDGFNAGLFGLLWALLTVLSWIPFFLGAFVTAPMGYIITSLIYRDMIGMPNVSFAVPEKQIADGSSWPPAPTIDAPKPTDKD